MIRSLAALAALSLAAEPAAPAPATQGEVRVEVRGLRDERGQLLVSLFANSKGFPEESDLALRSAVVPLEGGSTVVASFPGLEPGEYAVGVVHDANSNRRLDKSFFGVPREGFGTSNDVEPTIGAPSFEEARFRYEGGKRTLTITLIYY